MNENLNRIKNQFICVNGNQFIQVGNAEESQEAAGYIVEVLDWAGSKDVMAQMRSLNGVKSAILAYNVVNNAVLISSEQFHAQVLQEVLQLVQQVDLSAQNNLKLNFQMNEDRKALVSYLVSEKQKALKVQQEMSAVSLAKEVTPEATTPVAGNA
jgi:hypothetical protein